MTTPKLSNISLSKFRKFLQQQGLKPAKVKGGHEKWVGRNLERPIIIQTHIDPVPEFIVKQVLRHLQLSKEEFWKIYQEL